MINSTTFTQRNVITGVILAGLLTICAVALLVFVTSSSSDTAEGGTAKSAPAVIEPLDDGSGLARVTFVEKAVERIGIETSVVAEAKAVREGSSGALAVPYSAIMYDPKGQAFVYTVTEPLSYLRAPITIDYVEGDQAILSEGPSAGTEIVSLGVAELYGAETGVK